jgi:hypothetical protein
MVTRAKAAAGNLRFLGRAFFIVNPNATPRAWRRQLP